MLRWKYGASEEAEKNHARVCGTDGSGVLQCVAVCGYFVYFRARFVEVLCLSDFSASKILLRRNGPKAN